MKSQYRLALLLGLLFAAGCGQKGPLFLPDSPSQIKSEDAARQEQSQTGENVENKEKESQDE